VDVNVGRCVGKIGSLTSEFDSPSKRARLPARKNPYWQGISGGRGGVSLGYRKLAKGGGRWVAKIVVEGARYEEGIGSADDDGAGPGALSYRSAVASALAWSKRQHGALQAGRETGSDYRAVTVRTAIERYVGVRKSRSARDGANAAGRLKRHVLNGDKLADIPLAKLRATDIAAWRERITVGNDDSPGIKAATLNRLLNDLRAALNAAAAAAFREMPPTLPAEIKVGTKAAPVATNARKQILSDQQVAAVIEAAFAVDDEGDFGRMVLVAAATGARHSQIRALTVADVQAHHNRIMVPGSAKGRARQPRAPIAVPVSSSVIDSLRPAMTAHGLSEPLLQRWAYRRAGRLKWERSHRQAWGAAYEVEKPWAAAIAIAGLPSGTVMYALRHTSIVRGLRAGLPIRLVAALHDTSSEMIEQHYAAYIVDATEDLARRAALIFAGANSIQT
jgi:integrase